MLQPICRWGILGAATIARKNWKAIRNAENSTLVAVGSREKSRAQSFIDDCQAARRIPQCADRLRELRKNFWRAKISMPFIFHCRLEFARQWVTLAAESGKHVLCEKPCGVSSADLRAMLDACRKHKVQFMDGVMFMHSQRLPLVRQTLDDGQSIGAVKRIASSFCFLASDEFMQQNIRVSTDLEPLGALGDLGWYNIRFSLWTMKEHLPEKVTGRILAQHGPKR